MNPAARQTRAQRLSLQGPTPSHVSDRTGTCTVPNPSVAVTTAAHATRFAHLIIAHLLPGFAAVRAPRRIAAAADAGVVPCPGRGYLGIRSVGFR
jgi:hypothetical protein